MSDGNDTKKSQTSALPEASREATHKCYIIVPAPLGIEPNTIQYQSANRPLRWRQQRAFTLATAANQAYQVP